MKGNENNMNLRIKKKDDYLESRLMDTEELRAYTNLGRNNAMKLGEEIGAKVKIGKRVLWDRKKIDQYFNELTGAE